MEPVRVISEELVLVDWGPMTLTVSAWLGRRARPVMAARAARAALGFLRDLADFKNLLKLDQIRIPPDRPLPAVVEAAVEAVRQVDPSLTPLAAVAGAVAQEVCREAAGLGADRVIVNNGGDIALYLAQDREAVVGLKPPGGDSLVGKLSLDGRNGVGGVAASGWEGRSHSPGVADLVSIWAGSAALADAAATFVAGACRVDSPAVEKAPANRIDPESDLGEMEVTLSVGRLSQEEKEEAVRQGAVAAGHLLRAGLIRGCLLEVQGQRACLDPGGLFEPD